MTRDVVTLAAPAKLTLSLSVAARRPDGYHEIEAEMVSLDLSDTLEVSDGEGLEVIDAVRWWGDVGAGDAVTSGENLVLKALRCCGREAFVRLTKRIPTGAGLGGGSSDAAAVLRWAGWSDARAASQIGADVPFCLLGGRAKVSGIGEVVEPLPDVKRRSFLLVTPRLHVPTPAVYRAWDDLGGPTGDFGNDLEPAALALLPGLRWWRDVLAAAAGESPRLAGSGGTWFVEGERARLEQLAGQIRSDVVAARESALVEVVTSDG